MGHWNVLGLSCGRDVLCRGAHPKLQVTDDGGDGTVVRASQAVPEWERRLRAVGFRQQGDGYVCDFGKHAGKTLAEIPSGYVKWARTLEAPDGGVAELLEAADKANAWTHADLDPGAAVARLLRRGFAPVHLRSDLAEVANELRRRRGDEYAAPDDYDEYAEPEYDGADYEDVDGYGTEMDDAEFADDDDGEDDDADDEDADDDDEDDDEEADDEDADDEDGDEDDDDEDGDEPAPRTPQRKRGSSMTPSTPTTKKPRTV